MGISDSDFDTGGSADIHIATILYQRIQIMPNQMFNQI